MKDRKNKAKILSKNCKILWQHKNLEKITFGDLHSAFKLITDHINGRLANKKHKGPDMIWTALAPIPVYLKLRDFCFLSCW